MLFVVAIAIILLLAIAIMWPWSGQGPAAGRAPEQKMGQKVGQTPEQKKQRRGGRVALVTPVFVYGRLRDEPFAENTKTLNVSADGGLVLLSAKVIPSQELILANLQTDEEVRCRVARSAKAEGGRTLAGLELLQAAPKFWQIDFVSSSSRPSDEGNPPAGHLLNFLAAPAAQQESDSDRFRESLRVGRHSG